LHVDPHLRGLRAAVATQNIPPSWRSERESSEDRQRRVEVTFAHEDGGRARFVLVAPGHGRAPLITCDAYDVDAHVDPGVPEDAFATLLKWVHPRLAEASDGASAPVIASQPAGGPMLLRGRQRVTLPPQGAE